MKFLSLILYSLLLQSVFAQDGVEATAAQLQPSIMVIPFVKEGQQLRTVYESDGMLNVRIAVTKVREALDRKGISTVDFRAKIKQLEMSEHMSADNQSSMKQRVIELSGADVYVEVEAAVIDDADGASVSVNATAYDAFSGEVLAADVGTTPKFYTLNFEKLTQKAVASFIKDFTFNIQNKFETIVESGRTIVVDIGFNENAGMDMDSEMKDGQLFSDVLEEWFEQNAYQSDFHIQGVTATKMILDEVRIPVKDKKGRNYRVTKFAARLRSFLVKQDLEVTRDVVGSKVFITISD